MASSSVHFPEGRPLITQPARHWPPGFFDPVASEELAILRGGDVSAEGAWKDDFLDGILAARRSRSEAPF